MLPGILTVALTLSCAALAAASDHADYARSIAEWREKRLQRLVAPDSWLSLIGRHPVSRGGQSVGSAEGNAIRLAAGPAVLGRLTLDDANGITLALADGVDAAVDGTPVRVATLDYTGDRPTFVRVGSVSLQAMQRGGEFFLRVRDSEAPRRTKFPGIESFDTDESWRVTARWVVHDEPRELKITNILGQVSTHVVRGKAVFEVDGRTVELTPTQSAPEDELFFVFADETTDRETYGGGRFLYAAPPKDGTVVLDFNKAYNPPCAFTPFSTCPLPPRDNRMPVRVAAGEKFTAGGNY